MIRSDSIVGPFLVFVSLLLLSFFAGVSSTGGQHCVSEVRTQQRIPLSSVESFTWVRETSAGRFAAVTFKGNDGETTALCHFKENTHVILSIEYFAGDRLSQVQSNSSLVFF